MSKFVTTIPFDPGAVLAKLPKGAIVNELRLRDDARAVEILWEHDDVLSKYTFPVPWDDPSQPLPEELRFAAPALRSLGEGASRQAPAADSKPARRRGINARVTSKPAKAAA